MNDEKEYTIADVLMNIHDGQRFFIKTDTMEIVNPIEHLKKYLPENSTKGKSYNSIISIVLNNPESYDSEGTPGKKIGKEVLHVEPKGISDNLLGGMYRFYGTKEEVNNYICFGYNESTTDCTETSDYMYRIIGITSDGKMKLIKNTSIREGSTISFYWHSTNTTDTKWSDSLIFKKINSISLLTTGEWSNKIEDHSWLFGDIGYNDNKWLVDDTADNVYKIESGQASSWSGYGTSRGYSVSRWTDNITAKVGLMYISDYYYSVNGNGSINCYPSANGATCKKSWLHISNNGKSDDYQYEWTMVRYGMNGAGAYSAWRVTSDGQMNSYTFNGGYSVRPVFYLKSEGVRISGGDGTVGSPFIVEK